MGVIQQDKAYQAHNTAIAEQALTVNQDFATIF
jgi:hypothetical protein